MPTPTPRPSWVRWPPRPSRTPTTCAPAHASRLTAPRGWEVVRFEGEFAAPQPTSDDLTLLAEAVREAGRVDRPVEAAPVVGTGRRGHLRVLPGVRGLTGRVTSGLADRPS